MSFWCNEPRNVSFIGTCQFQHFELLTTTVEIVVDTNHVLGAPSVPTFKSMLKTNVIKKYPVTSDHVYDEDTQQVKLATHALVDTGMNDLGGEGEWQ